jgi:AcrR family transcriptional regulator
MSEPGATAPRTASHAPRPTPTATSTATVPASDAGHPTDGGRRLRADARRKREAILVAAAEAFLERGADIALDEVARRAGVGIGTLYRHFPSREALLTGAYVREVNLLCDGVEALLATQPADEALITWMQRFIGHVAERPGMAVALKSIVHATDPASVEASHQRIYTALRQLVHAAECSGAIRAGARSDDLAGALSGLSLITNHPGSRDRANRLVTLLVDGLRHGRHGAPTPPPPPPPARESGILSG